MTSLKFNLVLLILCILSCLLTCGCLPRMPDVPSLSAVKQAVAEAVAEEAQRYKGSNL